MSIELVNPAELDEPFTRSFRVKTTSLAPLLGQALEFEGVIDDDEELYRLEPDAYTGTVRIYVKRKERSES